jgi:hypothetical protein
VSQKLDCEDDGVSESVHTGAPLAYGEDPDLSIEFFECELSPRVGILVRGSKRTRGKLPQFIIPW